ACSTCHVIVAKEHFDSLPRASEMEEDMLDLAAGVRRTSRLACQIIPTDDLDGLTVHIPPESRNMQGPR
ncbi:MAG: 2Fe-2S iron-sulfur cluster-binding protein, partial [Afipia sp.]|nr:2Fe-2S iron-sulfur cluster-binding protein [Afipia sp.]